MFHLIALVFILSVCNGVPRYSDSSKYKPGQLPSLALLGKPRVFNFNNIPEEDKVADWNNPWNMGPRGFSIQEQPAGLMFNRNYMGKRAMNTEDFDGQKNLMRFFRIFKKSLQQEERQPEEVKRNFVPMLG